MVSLALSTFLAVLSAGIPLPAEDPAAPPIDGPYQRSLTLVREALQKRPQDARLYFILGDVHQRHRQHRGSLEAFQTALRLDPTLAEAQLRIGEVCTALGELDRAAEAYRRLISMNFPPLQIPARVNLSNVYFQAGKFAEAADELRQVVHPNDGSDEYRYQLARALDGQAKSLAGQPEAAARVSQLEDEAVQVLEEAARINAGHPRVHYLLGLLYQRRKKPAEARREMELFQKLRAERGDLASAAFQKEEEFFVADTVLQIARSGFEAGDASGALALLQGAIAGQPGALRLSNLEGWIHLKQQRFDDAARSYQRVLDRDPQNAEALWNFGTARLRAGRPEEAAPFLVRGAEVRKTFPDGWELLADLAIKGGSLAPRAEEFARAAVRYRPSPPNILRLLGLLRGRGDLQGCERLLQEGLQRNPGHPDLVRALQSLQGAPR